MVNNKKVIEMSQENSTFDRYLIDTCEEMENSVSESRLIEEEKTSKLPRINKKHYSKIEPHIPDELDYQNKKLSDSIIDKRKHNDKNSFENSVNPRF
jgi:hypothetical protein